MMDVAYDRSIIDFTKKEEADGSITLTIVPQYKGSAKDLTVNFNTATKGWADALKSAHIQEAWNKGPILIMYPGDNKTEAIYALAGPSATAVTKVEGTDVNMTVPLGRLAFDENATTGRIDVHYYNGDPETALINEWAQLSLIQPTWTDTTMTITGRVMSDGKNIARTSSAYTITKNVVYNEGSSTYPSGYTTVTINGHEIQQTFSERLTNTISSAWTSDWKKTVDIKVAAGDITMATAQRVVDASDVYQKGKDDGEAEFTLATKHSVLVADQSSHISLKTDTRYQASSQSYTVQGDAGVKIAEQELYKGNGSSGYLRGTAKQIYGGAYDNYSEFDRMVETTGRYSLGRITLYEKDGSEYHSLGNYYWHAWDYDATLYTPSTGTGGTMLYTKSGTQTSYKWISTDKSVGGYMYEGDGDYVTDRGQTQQAYVYSAEGTQYYKAGTKDIHEAVNGTTVYVPDTSGSSESYYKADNKSMYDETETLYKKV